MLELFYPLKKGTYHRVRGFNAHKIGWKGVDDGCVTDTPLYAMENGKISHTAKRSVGGGWSFILNFTKYPGWSAWYAHCSSIPKNGQTFKRGQVIGKSGATGVVTGPHLHYSILHREGKFLIARNPISVVKWVHTPMYLTKNQKTKICRDLLGRNCSSSAYKAKLTREDLLNKAYPEVLSNLKKLNFLRDDLVRIKNKHGEDLDKWLDIIKTRGEELGVRDEEIITLLEDKDNLQILLDTCIEKSQEKDAEKDVEKERVNRFSSSLLIIATAVNYVWETFIFPKLKLLRKGVNKYGRDK